MLRRYRLALLVVVPLIALGPTLTNSAAKAAKNKKLPVTLQAWTDLHGERHSDSVEFAGAALATCTHAQGPHPWGANCTINHLIVSPGSSVRATGRVTR
jgi:hypothetical protein